MFKIILLIIVLVSSGSYWGDTQKNLKNSTEIKAEIFKIYNKSDGKKEKNAVEIRNMIQRLINATLKEDLNFLPEIIERKKGIYLDLKGIWTYEALKEELQKKDSYFSIYFFDRDKLIQKKKSQDVHTVKELLILSGGIDLEMFFENEYSCEVKLRFKNNKNLERDLINPYFIKSEGKWYLYRLF